MARRFIPVAGIAVVVVAVVALLSAGGGDRHTVHATLSAANDVIPGIEVRSAGQKVGEVSEVNATKDGRAHVTLALDDAVWPLPAGSSIRPRLGSSVAYSGRWIALDLPRHSSGTIPEGGSIHATTAVEVDQVLSTFDLPTRRNLARTIAAGANLANRAKTGLARTLDRTPPALAQVDGLFRDLTASESDLHQLLRSTDRVVDAMVATDPGIETLISGAATTFSATADRAQRLEELLQRTPPVLVAGRKTLATADRTLGKARTLAVGLRPGLASLRRSAAPLNDLLAGVLDIGPTARATLAAARQGSPSLSRLLARVRRLSPQLKSAADQAGPQLACIRPYSPEIAGTASTWTSFLSYGDTQDKYARVIATALPFPNALPTVPPGLQTLVRDVFPRPPGQNAGQPWYLPECGVGEGVLSATNDPEMKVTRGGAR